MIKPISGYEGKYEVSSDGHIYALNYHRQGIRKETVGTHDKDGYKQVGLRWNGKRQYYRVHRLVAEAFIPNLNNLPQINHKNGIKDDNSMENIEWMSAADNIKHSFEHLHKDQKGEKNNNSKLTKAQVTEAWNLKGIKKQREIAEMLGIHIGNVDNIHRQKSWKWLTDELKQT